MNFWKELKKPIIGLAPMDGVTDFAMREVYSKIAKPDVLFTEFVSAEGLLKKKEKLLRILKFTDCQRPIVAQLFGQSPEAFFDAVKIVISLGFDGVDINMGCPARKVVLKNAGGALIGNYDLSEMIISSCLKAAGSFPVSIKTRVADEKWYSFLSGFKLSAVSLHGRYLKQGLTGNVDWCEIGRAGKIFKKKGIVILGNGGVKSVVEAKEKCDKYCLDGILIGRAALGNPWIFGNRRPVKSELFDAILMHAKIGNYPSILKHFGWYARGFNGARDLRVELFKTKNFEETKGVIKNYRD